jgi:hypothetical protein
LTFNAQLALAGEDLRGKRLVQLEQVDALERIKPHTSQTAGGGTGLGNRAQSQMILPMPLTFE